MPAPVQLQTHDDQLLTLSDLSDWGFTVHVKKNGYSAQQVFTLADADVLKDFAEQLEAMQKNNEGEARIEGEEGWLEFTLNSRGQLLVAGELNDYRVHKQTLRFVLETDQTCLALFIKDLQLANTANDTPNP